MTHVTLGERLQRARRRTRATLEEQAARFGVNRRTYIRWEQDDCTPDPGSLVKLFEYLQRFDAKLRLSDLVAPAPEPTTAAAGEGK